MCYQPNENESGINTQTESSTSRNHEELGIDRQPESSTSRNRGKRPISCIEDSVGLSWETSRSKQSKNLTRPRLKRNMILSGPSTSNPVSEPNVQIPGYNEDLSRVDMLAIAAAAEGDMVRNDLLQVDREFNEKQRDIKQQKIETVQRNHNNGIEIIDLDDSPITSSCVRDIPDAKELGFDRQPESSTSRNQAAAEGDIVRNDLLQVDRKFN
nr:hypothetical protein [Tanacetum cinerariifolium]